LRLIKQWLKAGGLETDGTGLPPASGTPQGGSGAPVLAQVSLHYALAVWLHKGVRPRCQGEAGRRRDADDVVGALQQQGDAERFSQAVGQRLGQVGLARAADKPRGLPCSHRQALGTTSFDWLGGECRWGRDVCFR
jgi:RNA-directed DNA polymerase